MGVRMHVYQPSPAALLPGSTLTEPEPGLKPRPTGITPLHPTSLCHGAQTSSPFLWVSWAISLLSFSFLIDPSVWIECLEPVHVVEWNIILFSILIALSGLQVIICLIRVVMQLSKMLCSTYSVIIQVTEPRWHLGLLHLSRKAQDSMGLVGKSLGCQSPNPTATSAALTCIPVLIAQFLTSCSYVSVGLP